MVEDLREALSRVRLFVMDVDGVLTDAGMYYSEHGDELKKFNTRDGKGIELLRGIGIITAIITSENTKLVERRAKKLKIDHLFQGIDKKLETLERLLDELDLSLSDVAYIGDDVNDLDVLRAVGFPVTVQDGMKQNKALAKYITEKKGGEGAVRELANLILEAQ